MIASHLPQPVLYLLGDALQRTCSPSSQCSLSPCGEGSTGGLSAHGPGSAAG
jgi:hypothetical protein